MLPAQDIKPFVVAQGKAETHNGIRLFSARKHPSSEEFMRTNIDAIESFAVVLERLCSGCFDLPMRSIAIYHDPTGNAIGKSSCRSMQVLTRNRRTPETLNMPLFMHFFVMWWQPSTQTVGSTAMCGIFSDW